MDPIRINAVMVGREWPIIMQRRLSTAVVGDRHRRLSGPLGE
ncbi:MAG: hypothetical protein ACOCYC_04375 [bacterium]